MSARQDPTNETLTTGQVSKLCKVAPRTVSKWIDTGRLPGYRLPGGSRDRRIVKADLIQFLKDHGMPLGEFGENKKEEGPKIILIVGASGTLTERIRIALPTEEGYQCCAVRTACAAGLSAARLAPSAIVIDTAMGRAEAIQIAVDLRKDEDVKATPIIAVAGEDESAMERLIECGFSEVFQNPFDVALLGASVRRALFAQHQGTV